MVFNVECYVVATPIGVLLRKPRVSEAVRRAPPVDIEPHRHTTPKWVVHRVCCTYEYMRVRRAYRYILDVRDGVQPRSGLGVYVCSRIRWWHSLRSLTTGYRGYTPFGV